MNLKVREVKRLCLGEQASQWQISDWSPGVLAPDCNPESENPSNKRDGLNSSVKV
jgi:hypothetical protein